VKNTTGHLVLPHAILVLTMKMKRTTGALAVLTRSSAARLLTLPSDVIQAVAAYTGTCKTLLLLNADRTGINAVGKIPFDPGHAATCLQVHVGCHGGALFKAATSGNAQIVAILLERVAACDQTADVCQTTLNCAVRSGDGATIRAVMAGSRIRPRVEDRDGELLCVAAVSGHVESLAELLAEWPAAASTPGFGNEALVSAALEGQDAAVRFLLSYTRIDQLVDGREACERALVYAARSGSVEVMHTLLTWPEKAPRADCRRGLALVMAADAGQVAAVRKLMTWPEHSPGAGAREVALKTAIIARHVGVVKAMLEPLSRGAAGLIQVVLDGA